MIWQKLQPSDFIQSFHTMKFNALVIIEIHPIFLGHRKHGFQMEEADIVNALHHVHFAMETLGDPIECCYMSFPASYNQMTTVSSVSCSKTANFRIFASASVYSAKNL